MRLCKKKIVIIKILLLLFIGNWFYKDYIRIQNIFDQMYYTRVRTHYDWWEGGLGGLGNKVTSFQKMPQIAPVPRDDESFYTSEGVFESNYKPEYLKKGERLSVSCGRDEKKLVISAEKQFKGYTISYWYIYYVKTKQLKESIGYYSSDQKYSKNTQEAIALAEKSGLTEKELVQYKKYFLYDKLLSDWLAVNSSRFSIDHWGYGKFIEELPPVSILDDNK